MGFTMFARCFFDIMYLVLLLCNDNLLILSHSLILDSSLLISDVMFLVVSSLDESIVVESVRMKSSSYYIIYYIAPVAIAPRSGIELTTSRTPVCGHFRCRVVIINF